MDDQTSHPDDIRERLAEHAGDVTCGPMCPTGPTRVLWLDLWREWDEADRPALDDEAAWRKTTTDNIRRNTTIGAAP